MSDKEIQMRVVEHEGQRYVRIVDMADLLRGVANQLETVPIIEGKEVSDALRLVARNMETSG